MFTFHEDAVHGWLEVPLTEIKRLNLVTDISAFSYVNKGKAYLEEDLDMTVFLNAYLQLNEDHNSWTTEDQDKVKRFWDSDCTRQYTDNFIGRSCYDRYDKTWSY